MIPRCSLVLWDQQQLVLSTVGLQTVCGRGATLLDMHWNCSVPARRPGILLASTGCTVPDTSFPCPPRWLFLALIGFLYSFENWAKLLLIMKLTPQKGSSGSFIPYGWIRRLHLSFFLMQKVLLLEDVNREDSSKGGRKTVCCVHQWGLKDFLVCLFSHVLLNSGLTASEAAGLQVIIR